jgi:hypothetical protein
MKNIVQIILIIVCIIFFNSVNLTCSFIDSGNAKIEMTLTVKLSPEVQARYWTVQRFFHDELTKMFLKISNITNSF